MSIVGFAYFIRFTRAWKEQRPKKVVANIIGTWFHLIVRSSYNIPFNLLKSGGFKKGIMTNDHEFGAFIVANLILGRENYSNSCNVDRPRFISLSLPIFTGTLHEVFTDFWASGPWWCSACSWFLTTTFRNMVTMFFLVSFNPSSSTRFMTG